MSSVRSAALVVAALSLVAVPVVAQSAPLTPARQALHDVYKDLIETNTEDSSGVGSVTVAAEKIAARFRAAGFPESDIHLLGPTPDKHSLVVRLHGSGAQKPLLLLAHLDVVIALPTDWTTDPFKLTEQDGYFQARGAIDDKAMASIFIANMLRYKQEGYTPDRDIILALTPDEEKGGTLGLGWLVANHRDLIDAAYAINEGGGGALKGGKPFINQVQATEKVSINFTLTAKNSGGHSSRPRPDNAIYELAAALVRVGQYSFPVQLNEVTRGYFSEIAKVESPATAALIRKLLADPSNVAVGAELSRDVIYNTTLRTTCVATLLSGGHAVNALPQTATATINCRVLPNTPSNDIRSALVRVVADTGIIVSAATPIPPTKPSPLLPELFTAVEQLTRQMFGDIPVVPVMSSGATDGKFLRDAGIPTYGVSALFVDPDDARAHGKNERVLQKSLYDSGDFLYELVKRVSSRAPVP